MEDIKYILLSERSCSDKATIIYESNFITLQKRQNYKDGKMTNDCQVFSGRVRSIVEDK